MAKRGRYLKRLIKLRGHMVACQLMFGSTLSSLGPVPDSGDTTHPRPSLEPR